MKVTEHIHALKIPFSLQVGPEKTLSRFVYAYLIYGEKIYLIDSGVSGSHRAIFDYVEETGRSPGDIDTLLFTHSHPDHIGGALAIKKETGCNTAAHKDAAAWIEDIDRQYRERPILNFYSLVEGSVAIERELRDGDSLDLGQGLTLKVFHTPGHSKGSVSFVLEPDMALFSGDAIPMAGGVPIYDEVLPSIASIRKLQKVKGLKVLMASWDEPHLGDSIYPLMEEGLNYFQNIHSVVLKESADFPASDVTTLGARVLSSLGLPETALIPIVIRSLEAHLKVAGHTDLLQV